MNYTQNDLDSFCLCIWRESRSEGIIGMRAVGHVIVNRVGAIGFPNTLHDVIYQKNAFTSMSVPSDSQFNLRPSSTDIQYDNITSLAPSILNGQDNDLTLGAHYYLNPVSATSGWFFNHIVSDPINHPKTVSIGRHDFYK